MPFPRLLLATLLLLACAGCATTSTPAPRTASPSEWPAYGRDGGGSRYSPLTGINKANVSSLEQAWEFHTGETDFESETGQSSAFETTPIFVDGTIYLNTPLGKVIALDPATGEERWRHDLRIDTARDFSEVTTRGVSSWKGGSGETAPCSRRIFIATIDARLAALDARDGSPCAGFGSGGVIDLSKGIPNLRPGQYQVTSPPAIIGDMVITGSSIGDNGGVELERGVVRAFDVRTGALRWSWDPIPTVKPVDGSWLGESWKRTGAANAWSILSVDEKLGLVFVPTSSPSPDYYGGERLGSNRHANSVVALEASTGTIRWAFQVVHHDLWDYDVASQPMLIEVPKDGTMIPAVAVGTKMGMVFLLDRSTGVPIYPVEERPVPQTDVAGEVTSPTQPFPVREEPLVPHSLRADEVWGENEEDLELCRKIVAGSRSEGIFTPPSLRGSISAPGNVGGMHWGGMTWDPTRKLLITNTNRIPALARLIPRDDTNRFRESSDSRVHGEYASQRGTPFGMYREILISPRFIPCSRPPWGALSAMDLTTGKIAWEVPLGTIPYLSFIKGYESYGSPNLGGAITTGGLVFVAAAMDTALRAFDVDNGTLLWKGELPASAQATPMTYEYQGKQYVVIAAGGHGGMRTKRGDSVVAFSVGEGK